MAKTVTPTSPKPRAARPSRGASGYLVESITSSFDGKQNVDANAGIIKDVKLCGLSSSRGYDYSPAGLKAAVRLYEGVNVYPDHPSKNSPGRSVREVTAVVINPRFVEGDGIRGDLKVFKEAPSGRFLLEAAQDPDKSRAVGMSHNADPTWLGKNRPDMKKDPKTGRLTVMGISKVYSVDLVDNPATTNGLYESADMEPETISLRDVFAKAFPVGKTKTELGKLLEDMGMGDTAMAMPAEDASHEAQVEDAFLAMVTAVWRDDSLDAKTKLAKIKDIANAQEKLLGGGASAEGAATEEDDDKSGKAQEDDDKEQKGKAQEGKPCGFGKVLELGKKYKVDDAGILEEAAALPLPRAMKLLESVGRGRLGASNETTIAAGRSKTAAKTDVPDSWEEHKKRLKESLSEEDGEGYLLEAVGAE